jgi:DNA-binding transcriptional MerR regulator
MKERQLKIGDVSRVTGVAIHTLGRWIDRRTIRQSRDEHHSTGTGDCRTFNRATINQIALSKRLIAMGVPAGRANAAAATFTAQSQPGRAANEPFEFGLTVMAYSEGGTTIRNLDPEDSIADAFGRDFDSFIIVNIGPVITAVNKLVSPKENNI